MRRRWHGWELQDTVRELDQLVGVQSEIVVLAPVPLIGKELGDLPGRFAGTGGSHVGCLSRGEEERQRLVADGGWQYNAVRGVRPLFLIFLTQRQVRGRAFKSGGR